ncbi:MAG: hypoxanthine phosphoribosyltransferase [Candidatus Woesearchaeota archaeon]
MPDLRNKDLRELPIDYGNALCGILISEDEIQQQVKKIAESIKESNKMWHCVIALNGALFFAADLLRELRDCTYDTIQVSSYEGTQSTRTPEIKKSLSKPVKGRDVLVIEDIIDTGHTAKFLRQYLEDQGANSVKIAALLSKPDRRETEICIDYLGFIVPDKFLVGYGLDHNQENRNLKFIAVKA